MFISSKRRFKSFLLVLYIINIVTILKALTRQIQKPESEKEYIIYLICKDANK